jgi:hypothetical protein
MVVAWVRENGAMNDTSDRTQASPEEAAGRRQIGAQCGHVKRNVARGKRLTGKTLEFALSVVGEDSEIGEKLKTGTPLTDYESHLLVDVHLLHVRLGARAERKLPLLKTSFIFD